MEQPGVAPKPLHDFDFITANAGALRGLMYAMRDLRKSVRFIFDATGIQISEQACCDSLCIFANFRADRFNKYTATGPGVISFQPEQLYAVLSNHRQSDKIRMRFDHKRERELDISIIHEDESIDQDYTLQLPVALSSVFEAPSTEVDYLLAVDPGVLTNILNCVIAHKDDFPVNRSADSAKSRASKRDARRAAPRAHALRPRRGCGCGCPRPCLGVMKL
jgi:hypothetical protein